MGMKKQFSLFRLKINKLKKFIETFETSGSLGLR